MSWDSLQKRVEGVEGGLFVKLKNHGDKHALVFLGEPHVRDVVWLDNKPVNFDRDNPSHSGAGVRKQAKISINAYSPNDNAMKILEQGPKFFKDLLLVRQKFPLDRWVLEVQRDGKPMDPGTRYSILPDREIDDALRAKLAQHELHDLEALFGGGANGGAADDNIPF